MSQKSKYQSEASWRLRYRPYIVGKEYITEGGISGAEGSLSVKVSKDDVFLLSDNRRSTMDSRNKKLGTVDMREIKGNVKFIIWPLSDLGGVQ